MKPPSARKRSQSASACQARGRVGDDDVDADNRSGLAGLYRAAHLGQSPPRGLGEVHRGFAAEPPEPGHQVPALGQVDAQGLFQKDRLAGLGGRQGQGFARARRAGEVDGLGRGHGLGRRGGDRHFGRLLAGLGAGRLGRVPESHRREGRMPDHVGQHAPAHDAQADDGKAMFGVHGVGASVGVRAFRAKDYPLCSRGSNDGSGVAPSKFEKPLPRHCALQYFLLHCTKYAM